MNYVPVDAGTISTNISESSSSKPQDHCNTEVHESSRNTNPTASTLNLPADQLETLTVESPIPTVCSPVPTACFNDSLEPSKPKKISDALQDPSWVEAMQEELLKFKIQRVWTLVDCPKG
nr:retrotransposon protein, putative, unclassified [Tanacetum cinerariifolium]